MSVRVSSFSVSSVSRFLSIALVLVTLGGMAYQVCAPLFADLHAMGFHDWDSAAAYRHITALSLRGYGEFPGWHPWLCGGFPAWAYSEGVPNLLSPYLPAYLFLPIELAVRVEALGQSLLVLGGMYLLAGRYTRRVSLRLFVAVVAALNGRWALQLAAGHLWHLQYAWTPFVLYFFDRACVEHKKKYAVYAGLCLAMIVYMAGIYPVTHTALLLGLYACGWGVCTRTFSPLGMLALTGVSSLGLSAPKLLPVLELMQRFPRTLPSGEVMNVVQLAAMLAHPDQSFFHAPVAIGPYGWHEWGIYVGVVPTLAMLLALLYGRGRKENLLRGVGGVFLLLSMGAFHAVAPWTLLHKLPVFASQHVPSRFLYLAVMCLSLAFAAWAERCWQPMFLKFRGFDLLLCGLVLWLSVDVARVGEGISSHVFYLQMPKVERSAQFRQLSFPRAEYTPPDAWAGPVVLAMQANEGFVQCYSVPERGEPRGALAADDPAYRGEAYVAEGGGQAQVVSFTPNRAVVRYTGVSPGSLIVYNMNFDPGWSAEGKPAQAYRHAVAGVASSSEGEIHFRYIPYGFSLGLLIAAFTVLALGLILLWPRFDFCFLRGKAHDKHPA